MPKDEAFGATVLDQEIATTFRTVNLESAREATCCQPIFESAILEPDADPPGVRVRKVYVILEYCMQEAWWASIEEGVPRVDWSPDSAASKLNRVSHNCTRELDTSLKVTINQFNPANNFGAEEGEEQRLGGLYPARDHLIEQFLVDFNALEREPITGVDEGIEV
jgi:hypothetical protein